MTGAKQLSLASDKRHRQQGKEKEEKIGVGENRSVRERVGNSQVCTRRVRTPPATAWGARSLGVVQRSAAFAIS